MEERKQLEKVNGHFFTDGEKVTLELKVITRYGFETQYGWNTVIIFEDVNKRQFKYIGSAPPKLKEGETVNIKATIKHSEYNYIKETRLQRIKI